MAFADFVRGVMMSEIPIIIFNCIGKSSHATHQLEPYDRLFGHCMNKFVYQRNVIGSLEIVDLFARQCPWGTVRNDINPQLYPAYTTHSMDALECIKGLKRNSAHIILFDPPFSDRQSAEEYGTSNLYTDPSYIAEIGQEMFRVLQPGGFLIKCGYNTNAPAKGFECVKVFIANFGASRNDILFSLWTKTQTSLQVGLN